VEKKDNFALHWFFSRACIRDKMRRGRLRMTSIPIRSARSAVDQLSGVRVADVTPGALVSLIAKGPSRGSPITPFHWCGGTTTALRVATAAEEGPRAVEPNDADVRSTLVRRDTSRREAAILLAQAAPHQVLRGVHLMSAGRYHHA
jgi:hypothetical protein